MIFFIVALPPPVHGQSLVNSSVLGAVKQTEHPFFIVDVSPGLAKRGIRYHLNRVIRYARAWVELLSSARRATVLYTVYESGGGYVYNFVTALVSRIARVPVVLHHHTSQHSLQASKRFLLLSALLGRRTTHIALSDAMARDLRTRYRCNTVVCSNAAFIEDGGWSRNDQGQPLRDKLVIGSLANLSYEKGLHDVLATFRRLLEEGFDVDLHLAGPLSTSMDEELLSNLQTAHPDRVRYFGRVSGEAKVSFYKSLDVFLFPSRYRFEAQPLVILEAMSFGIPVVCSSAGYSAELVDTGGRVCDDLGRYADTVRELIQTLSLDACSRFRYRALARARYEALLEESARQRDELLAMLIRR